MTMDDKRDPEAHKARFSEYPPPTVIDDFRSHVSATGQPDSWSLHCASVPPAGGGFEVLTDFAVPERLRASVPMATCPICSPSDPQYYEGALIWFKDERKMRAVGNRCAERHFGADRYRFALSRKRAVEDRRADEQFILDFLPQSRLWRSHAGKLRAIADEVDRFLIKLARSAPRGGWTQLTRSTKDGRLEVLDEHEVTIVMADGRERRERQTYVKWSTAVSGLGILKGDVSIGSCVDKSDELLNRLPENVDDDSVLRFVVEWGEARYRELVTSIQSMKKTLEKARDLIGEAQAFVAADNLSALAHWFRLDPVGISIRVHWSAQAPARIAVGEVGKQLHPLAIPEVLFKTLPSSP